MKVTHCLGSNLKLASGIAGVPDLLSQHTHVGLGADGTPYMFQEMRLAALIQKIPYGPTALNAKTVLRMATLAGAEVLGMEQDIGSVEPGKKADLILLDLNDFHTYPSYDADPYSRIVYSATRGDVDTVIIDEKIVMEGKRQLTVDKTAVLQEADRCIERLLKRI